MKNPFVKFRSLRYFTQWTHESITANRKPLRHIPETKSLIILVIHAMLKEKSSSPFQYSYELLTQTRFISPPRTSRAELQ